MSGYHTKGHLRPHVWVTGTDPVRHEQYHCWQMHKAQCKYRGEEFDLSFEQYEELWQGLWHKRGRTPQDVCMTRIDWDGAWEWGNVEVITRAEHFKRQGLYRQARMLENLSKGRSKAQEKTKKQINKSYVKKVQK